MLLKIERYKLSISKRERELDTLTKQIHQAQLEEADHRQVAVRLNIREEEIQDAIKLKLGEASKVCMYVWYGMDVMRLFVAKERQKEDRYVW